MKTMLEKELEKMTPQQRKKAVASISDMMGMPQKKKATKSTSTKKKK